MLEEIYAVVVGIMLSSILGLQIAQYSEMRSLKTAIQMIAREHHANHGGDEILVGT